MKVNKHNGTRAALYTVSRCKGDDALYGPIHWSSDGETTFCGFDMTNEAWFILTNDFSGNANCKKCIKASNTIITGCGTIFNNYVGIK